MFYCDGHKTYARFNHQEVAEGAGLLDYMDIIGNAYGAVAAGAVSDYWIEEIQSHIDVDMDTKYVVRVGYETEDGFQEGVTNHTLADIIREVVDDTVLNLYRKRSFHSESDLRKIRSLQKLIAVYEEVLECGDVHCISVLTVEEHQKKEDTKRRKKLDQELSQLCDRKNLEIGSFEMFDAIAEEIDRTHRYREGMREDGLCIGYGVTSEQWFEEYNASQSDTHHWRELLDRLSRTCPVTYMEWKAAKQRELAEV
jgi:hypothetical protein